MRQLKITECTIQFNSIPIICSSYENTWNLFSIVNNRKRKQSANNWLRLCILECYRLNALKKNIPRMRDVNCKLTNSRYPNSLIGISVCHFLPQFSSRGHCKHSLPLRVNFSKDLFFGAFMTRQKLTSTNQNCLLILEELRAYFPGESSKQLAF